MSRCAVELVRVDKITGEDITVYDKKEVLNKYNSCPAFLSLAEIRAENKLFYKQPWYKRIGRKPLHFEHRYKWDSDDDCVCFHVDHTEIRVDIGEVDIPKKSKGFVCKNCARLADYPPRSD